MRRIAVLAAIASLVLAASGVPGAAQAVSENAGLEPLPPCSTPPVSTSAGRFCGLAVTVEDADGTAAVDAFEGIRYGIAKRWAAPAPVPAGLPLTAATKFGPICPQAPIKGLAQSENCLFLNLWTPTRSSVKALPVMVFIHGGAFITGAGSLPVYDGARLAAHDDVIIVTLNYRLGALGFLAGGSGSDRLAGNYGFRDQRLALQWVRKNIRSFGGDPAKVTIFGESAGAMSVGAHLVSPGSRSLFRNAIMESNPYGVPFKTTSQAATIRQEFNQTAATRACKGRVACLAKLPAATIVKAQGEVVPLEPVLFQGELGAILAWAPYVDGTLIARQPNKVAVMPPVIAGTNRDEGTLFVDQALPRGLTNVEYEALVAVVFARYAEQIVKQARYRPDGKGNLVPLANVVGDYFFSCATRHVLGAAKGARFGYAFDHPPSYPVWPTAPKACQPGPAPTMGKVCHALELPFIFRNPVSITLPPVQHHFTRAEQTLVDAISDYWTSLAANGDPNPSAAPAPAWPPFGVPGTRQILNLKISQTKDAALNCPLWDKVGYDQGSASLY